MNTEERIRIHLQSTTSTLHAPDRLEEVMQEGRLRRIRRDFATMLGAAALLATVVAVAAGLTPPGPDSLATSPATSTETVVTSTTSESSASTAPHVATEVPCTPTGLSLPDQDLPEAVAETRRTLFDLASDCDYEGLAALVAEGGVNVSFGGPTDPIRLWVTEASTGVEPVSLLAALLTTPAGYDPEADLYAWPRVHIDPSDSTAWDEVEEATRNLQEELTRFESEYLGYRVGIASDGTWLFFVAGD